MSKIYVVLINRSCIIHYELKLNVIGHNTIIIIIMNTKIIYSTRNTFIFKTLHGQIGQFTLIICN